MRVKKYCLFTVIVAIVFFAAWAASLAATGPALYKSLYFKSDSNTLRSDSVQALNQTIADLKANPAWRLIIEGHTDDSGAAESNRRLSIIRAKTIMDLMVAGGIDAGRLEVQGYGEARPLADNQTLEGRARNRRVELYQVLPASPKAVVPVSRFEFESVVEGHQVVHEFRIQNQGQAPLEIEKVKTG
jgi:hypothetical protein